MCRELLYFRKNGRNFSDSSKFKLRHKILFMEYKHKWYAPVLYVSKDIINYIDLNSNIEIWKELLAN